MKKAVLLLALVVCVFFFIACSPSKEEYKAEVEKRINTSGNKGKALQEVEAAIMRQLAKEEKEKQEIASQKKRR